MHLECLATLFDPKNSTNFVSIHTLSARELCGCSFCFLRWEKGKREEMFVKPAPDFPQPWGRRGECHRVIESFRLEEMTQISSSNCQPTPPCLLTRRPSVPHPCSSGAPPGTVTPLLLGQLCQQHLENKCFPIANLTLPWGSGSSYLWSPIMVTWQSTSQASPAKGKQAVWHLSPDTFPLPATTAAPET